MTIAGISQQGRYSRFHVTIFEEVLMLNHAIARTRQSSLKAAFRNERGAMDLVSIMVGIVVIGVVAGTIAAIVFAVIPWSQDRTAQSELDGVANAQSAYMGLALEAGGPAYGSKAELENPKFNGKKSSPLLSDPDNHITIVNVDPKNPNSEKPYYKATIKSSSGATFVSINGAAAEKMNN